jgi:Na+/H+ antiporter NhaD/arsenite permease-like protein
MSRKWMLGIAVSWLAAAPMAHAAGDHGPLDLPIWSVVPFVALLLGIALLPLVAEHWWHQNKNKAIVSAVVGVPVLVYLFIVHLTTEQAALIPLGHEILKYVSFIVLLGSLYTVAGGIVFRGDLEPRPLTNTAILAFGCVLANMISTTGASVLLIRPLLRINKSRRHTSHLPIFFVFTVSNTGGLLTPLGDPPLFLGFLNGVPFTWTLTLWLPWLLVNGVLLAVLLVWDTIAYRREVVGLVAGDSAPRQPLRVEGLVNLPLLAGIIAGVLVQGVVEGERGELIGAGVMVVMAGLSLWLTPQRLRAANDFTWHPIIEVAVLFAGIFVAMVPALELLKLHGKGLGIQEPWQYFWLTGGLSGFLDNAPTYLAFATMAGGDAPIGELTRSAPDLLAAISCGAVFMGALTYIGNGPNFMVKAIADSSGYSMPSFFGYLGYSCLILAPVLVIVTFVFFRPF